jgi:peptide/nickel transport system permease protein
MGHRSKERSLIEFWKRYRKNRAAVFGLVIFMVVVLVAIAAPLIAPYRFKTLESEALVPPTPQHPMGSDDLGRDILSGVIYGSRSSLLVGGSTTLIAVLVGIVVGSIAGYYGGKIDSILMRTTDGFLILPTFLVIIAFVALFGSSLIVTIAIMAALNWTRTARLIRAEFLTLREREFVVAARAMGARDRDLIFGEILPNSLAPVIVDASLMVGAMILLEAAISFLGLGDVSIVSWGKMLFNAQPYIREAWWMAVFPGLAIFATVLSINLIGDGLNDAFNPRLKQRGLRVG